MTIQPYQESEKTFLLNPRQQENHATDVIQMTKLSMLETVLPYGELFVYIVMLSLSHIFLCIVCDIVDNHVVSKVSL